MKTIAIRPLPSGTEPALRRRLGVALLALAALSGCAASSVQPWEKGLLAQPGMTFEGDRLNAAYLEHTYASKEGAAGGAAVGGGGCGCN